MSCPFVSVEGAPHLLRLTFAVEQACDRLLVYLGSISQCASLRLELNITVEVLQLVATRTTGCSCPIFLVSFLNRLPFFKPFFFIARPEYISPSRDNTHKRSSAFMASYSIAWNLIAGLNAPDVCCLLG